MKKCPSCSTVNDDSSKFCKSCGIKLPSKTICPYCKKEINSSDPFCKHCGKSLVAEHGRRKIGKKLKIALISIGSVAGFILIAYLSLFLFTKYYLAKRYYEPGTLDNAAIPGEDIEAEPSFGDLIIAKSIDDSTYEPINPSNEFEIGFREIYAAIDVSGVSPDDIFTYRWKYADTKEVISEFSFNYFKPEGYIPDYIALSEDDNIDDYSLFSEPGGYVVEFYHNDILESEAYFTINEADSMDPMDASFGELITSKSSSPEDDSPIEPTDKFILGTKKICASIKVEGAKNTDRWEFMFISEDDDNFVKVFKDYYYLDEGVESFNGYKSICLYIPEGRDIEGIDIFGFPGKYFVGFSHNDNLISSKEFEVIDAGVYFGNLITCSDANLQDDSPIDITDDFIYSINQILVSIDIRGADLEDECRFVWINKDSGQILRDYTYKYKDNWKGNETQYNGYFTMGIVLGEDMELEEHDLLGVIGNYKVEFYHNGYLISEKSFKIREE